MHHTHISHNNNITNKFQTVMITINEQSDQIITMNDTVYNRYFLTLNKLIDSQITIAV